MCVCLSVCLSVLEVSLPPIGRLAPSERVGRGFKDFFGTRGGEGGNGLLGKGGKTLSCLPPPPIAGPGSCTWSISKLEIGGGGGEVTIAHGHLSSRVLLPLIPGCQKETRTENKVVIAYIP